MDIDVNTACRYAVFSLSRGAGNGCMASCSIDSILRRGAPGAIASGIVAGAVWLEIRGGSPMC